MPKNQRQSASIRSLLSHGHCLLPCPEVRPQPASAQAARPAAESPRAVDGGRPSAAAVPESRFRDDWGLGVSCASHYSQGLACATSVQSANPVKPLRHIVQIETAQRTSKATNVRLQYSP